MEFATGGWPTCLKGYDTCFLSYWIDTKKEEKRRIIDLHAGFKPNIFSLQLHDGRKIIHLISAHSTIWPFEHASLEYAEIYKKGRVAYIKLSLKSIKL